MLKSLFEKYWLYVLLVIAGLVMLVTKFSQGNWQVGMIWLAATAYWLVKLYQKYQVLKNTQK
ncbi:hypothetical protein EI998_04640 [Streptococcus suis]|uniref:Uncharacterized protein n=1 Tax=Streptococcus suis TaxID=1307 RepID=A0A3R8SIS0_STRSU|nr:hypothetical protein EI998_04640 [Streptococcus suis]